jgi:hypothetical protein
MKYFLLLFFAGCSLCPAAQNRSRNFGFNTAVSVNPFMLIGEDITFMVGAEHQLKDKLSVVMDAGYIFYSDYFNGSDVLKSVSGFNLRPGIKFYVHERKRSYLMAQLFYKQVGYKVYDFLGKDCVNDVPTYEQLQDFTYRKRTISMNFIAGKYYHLSDKLLFEFYGGIGVKSKTQRPTEDNSCYRENQRGIIFSKFQEQMTAPNFPVGFKLVYIIE